MYNEKCRYIEAKSAYCYCSYATLLFVIVQISLQLEVYTMLCKFHHNRMTLVHIL